MDGWMDGAVSMLCIDGGVSIHAPMHVPLMPF